VVFPKRQPKGPESAVAPAGTGDGVRVLARGLTLLKAFMPRNLPLSNGELALATGLPRPTVSRITESLTRMGYLDYLAPTAQYRLGTSALTLGFGALSGLDVRTRARVRMQRFAEREDLLVALASRDGMAMVCHEICRGRGALTIRVGVGSRLVLPHSAMGRALIATLAPDRLAVVMDEIRQHFPRLRLRAVMDDAQAQVRKHGFCVTVSSLEPDVNSIGTPLVFAQAPGHYMLGCSVPAFRYPPERCRDELGPKLLQLRHEIEQDLQPLEAH
jgi:DNA-binding IclR family transcriptional regulator